MGALVLRSRHKGQDRSDEGRGGPRVVEARRRSDAGFDGQVPRRACERDGRADARNRRRRGPSRLSGVGHAARRGGEKGPAGAPRARREAKARRLRQDEPHSADEGPFPVALGVGRLRPGRFLSLRRRRMEHEDIPLRAHRRRRPYEEQYRTGGGGA